MDNQTASNLWDCYCGNQGTDEFMRNSRTAMGADTDAWAAARAYVEDLEAGNEIDEDDDPDTLIAALVHQIERDEQGEWADLPDRSVHTSGAIVILSFGLWVAYEASNRRVTDKRGWSFAAQRNRSAAKRAVERAIAARAVRS